jgi:hypothetical protein
MSERDWADEAAEKIAAELDVWGYHDDAEPNRSETLAIIAEVIREAAARERARDGDPE